MTFVGPFIDSGRSPNSALDPFRGRTELPQMSIVRRTNRIGVLMRIVDQGGCDSTGRLE
jgi:hypothetical protein